MEAMNELIIEAVAFFCEIASAWMFLENRMNEISLQQLNGYRKEGWEVEEIKG